MKKLLVILLLIAAINASAQTEKAFFTRDSASMINIANMVIANAKTKYVLDKVIPRYSVVAISYRNENKSLLQLTFKFFPDRSVVLTHITGDYEDIFPFWKKYFDADAEMVTERPKAKEVKPITVPFLNGNAEFYFRKMNTRMGEFTAVYKVDPAKNK